MRPALDRYASFVFDCDGVVLDSNRLKTEAFATIARPWGQAVVDAFVAHHRLNGGVSRYEKVRFLVQELLGRGDDDELVDELLASYAAEVSEGLRRCAEAPGLTALRERTRGRGWMMASGGDERELRAAFAERGRAAYFDLGIFGSPTPKMEILARARAQALLVDPVLFLGDSRYDHECAAAHGCDFVFVSNWSEFEQHEAYCAEHALPIVHDLGELARAERA